MGFLDDYNTKRDFRRTPEPRGKRVEAEEKNRFVVQKHMASHEHYDLRLQSGDVLVSWAIPKMPVSDPKVKRLAVKVEDHPLEYIHFEGTIPSGNYGAGTVMVWDIGYYYLGRQKAFPTEKDLRNGLAKGSLKLYLQGTRLKGFFNLVSYRESDKDEWFFTRAGHEGDDDDPEERSALTGRTMEEIARSKNNEWTPPGNKENKNGGSKAVKGEFPGFIPPMLATLSRGAFSHPDWLFEPKLDGYRVIAAKNNTETKLFSRNGNVFTEKYPGIARDLSGINAQFVTDGEVCYLDNHGNPDFQALQHKPGRQENLHYYVFDLLWLNGYDLKKLPLTERKKLLAVLLEKAPDHVHYLDHIEERGELLFAEMERNGAEGIIAKKAGGRYYQGERSKEWLKVKTGHRQEMLICGYIRSEKQPQYFSSLLCAVNRSGDLEYAGRVGTGFTVAMKGEIMKKLSDLELNRSPVVNPPDIRDIRWVKPELICEVKFSTWTKGLIMRHPSFIGLRSDKVPMEITEEKKVNPPGNPSRVKFTNTGKIFWPGEGLTKGDVIDYYRDMSRIILPYLKNRPQSLYRTPGGIGDKGFFQKNVGDIAPDWIETYRMAESSGKEINYLLCQDEDALMYMVNLGCIEINPWSSSLPNPDNPDFMIFDLDPVDVEFERLVDLAHAFHNLFEQLSLPSYVKTSGSRGLHIYIPVKQKYSYKQVQDFVRLIETHIHKKLRDLTSFERSPSARKGKIYLDYLQNARGKTMASVYSVRPRPGAPVSAPIRWEELTPDLRPTDFNMMNMRERLSEEGDIWEGIFDHRVDLEEELRAEG